MLIAAAFILCRSPASHARACARRIHIIEQERYRFLSEAVEACALTALRYCGKCYIEA